jgi:hypothetical protein
MLFHNEEPALFADRTKNFIRVGVLFSTPRSQINRSLFGSFSSEKELLS